MKLIDYEKTIELLKKIVTESKCKNNVYLVGGAVRDIVLKRPPKDIDLCIDYPDGTEYFTKYLKEYWKDCCKDFVTYPRYGTSKFTLILENNSEVEIECVIPRVETYNNGPRKPDSISQCNIQEDAMRRDFCCNALYMNIISGEILDPTGKGIEDCHNKILRTPLDPEETFRDDPLRMLRAIRFSCTKGFNILPEVFEKIGPYTEYYELSMERINDEFTKMMESDESVKAIRYLHTCGLLEHIIPELEESWGFDQHSKYHSLNMTEHILSVLGKLDSNFVVRHRAPKDYISLKLAGLLHDIAKYKIYQVKPDGSYSFKGHDIASSEMAKDILTRLKYSNSTIDLACSLIKNHMCMKSLYDYSEKIYKAKNKTTMKLAKLFGDHMEANLALINADNCSHAPEYNMSWQTSSFRKEYKKLREKYNKPNLQVPITGDDIMYRLGIKPGKLVAQIKNKLQDLLFEYPDMTGDELWNRYTSDYSGTFWVTRSSVGDWVAFLNEPVWSEKYKMYIPDYDNHDICNQEESIYPSDLFNEHIKISEKKEIQGYMFPVLYSRLVRNYIARGIIHNKSGICLDRLEALDGFSKLELTLQDHDLVVNIYWTDGTITCIM